MKRVPIALSLMAAFSVAPGVSAQSVSEQPVEQELRTLTAASTATSERRARLDSFLEREDVQATATEHGVDLRRVKAGVKTLDDGAVASLTERLRDATGENHLVGGDTFVVTSSTIIIVLLVVILIAVA